MTYYELRWQQRFQNFSKAFLLLEECVAIENNIKSKYYPVLKSLYDVFSKK